MLRKKVFEMGVGEMLAAGLAGFVGPRERSGKLTMRPAECPSEITRRGRRACNPSEQASLGAADTTQSSI